MGSEIGEENGRPTEIDLSRWERKRLVDTINVVLRSIYLSYRTLLAVGSIKTIC